MFQFSEITPWGKNLQESKAIFGLTDEDMDKKMAGFADGASSLNCELTRMGKSIISLDPVYGLSKEYLQACFNQVMEQSSQFIRKSATGQKAQLKSIERIRKRTVSLFLEDYEVGKEEGRYRQYSLPGATGFADLSFELGLCSNFILLYEELGIDFHLAAVAEMLRVCREIRIFPVVNFAGHHSAMLPPLIGYFQHAFEIEFVAVYCEPGPHEYSMLRMSRH
ncbi:MAG: hypothetical protein BGO55_13610 [Sphingobacteriales bacterium 50-39]|nr:hypothetical protein [Sphingobacteriales bacterium]OJW57333.1 MAG: hypothetical protein BGO55_13610 [Sphingobacteriales bacterium 50-39]